MAHAHLVLKEVEATMSTKDRSYVFEWGVNKIVVEGADSDDVVFSHEDPRVQTVNVTKLWEEIQQNKVKFRTLMAILDREMIENVLRDRDIDPKTVERVMNDPEDYDSPVLFAGTEKLAFLVDGTHRLYCRFLRKELNVKAYMVSFETLEKFKVRFLVNGKPIMDTRESIMSTFQFNKPPEST
jgi:hypothetical protein